MADEVEDEVTLRAKDVRVVTPPGKLGSTEEISVALSDSYGSSLKNNLLQKQHRAVLASIGQIADVSEVTALSLTASGTYQQAEAQQVVDKLNEVLQAVAEIRSVLASLKVTAADTIVKP